MTVLPVHQIGGRIKKGCLGDSLNPTLDKAEKLARLAVDGEVSLELNLLHLVASVTLGLVAGLVVAVVVEGLGRQPRIGVSSREGCVPRLDAPAKELVRGVVVLYPSLESDLVLAVDEQPVVLVCGNIDA